MTLTSHPRALWIGGILIAAIVFAYMGSEFQRVSSSLFTSPDETAVYVFARAWHPGGGFRIPSGLPAELSAYAGLHPRSMVQQGGVLVPVGFLGMPMLVAFAERAFTGSGAYLTLLLVLSASYPLWRLAGGGTQNRLALLTVLFFLTFPTVILYENRGLFPNLPVVVLAIWSVWGWMGIGERQAAGREFDAAQGARVFVAGGALGLALLIRPIEAVWLLPWVAWGTWKGWNMRAWPLYGLSAGVAALLCAYGVWEAYLSYSVGSGSLWPPIGYALHDSTTGVMSVSASSAEGSFRLPYGFHPRVALEHVRVYLLTYVGLWTGVSLAGMYVALRAHRTKSHIVFAALSVWTVAVLLLLYGQSLYADNIRGNISLGNSFLRYMLPLAPLMAYGMARAVNSIWKVPSRGAILGIAATCFIVLAGVATVYAKDEEGILQTRYELQRYVMIREEADKVIPAGSLVLSERSDKIFASGHSIAVSPIPSGDTMRALLASDRHVFLFHRLLGAEVKDVFGVTNGKLLFYIGNEGMYLLQNEPISNQGNIPSAASK